MADIPRERSQAEVVARIRDNERRRQDMFGFEFEVLGAHLDDKHVQEFLTEGSDLSEWEPHPLHIESIMYELGVYMEYAWGKVRDHRGLSANRSIDKMKAYVWLLGLDDLLTKLEETEYPQYGAPKMAVICLALDLPVPNSKDIQNMIAGLSCEPGCDWGCG